MDFELILNDNIMDTKKANDFLEKNRNWDYEQSITKYAIARVMTPFAETYHQSKIQNTESKNDSLAAGSENGSYSTVTPVDVSVENSESIKQTSDETLPSTTQAKEVCECGNSKHPESSHCDRCIEESFIINQTG